MLEQDQKERERAQRRLLILTTARDLAEAEGWAAVTTRRLARQIQHSQPVLYSHFAGKSAILAAVAEAGFAELAGELRVARTAANGPQEALRDVAAAYARFARRRPAQYDAMFKHAIDLPFADPDVPLPLQHAFAELCQTLRPFALGDDAATLAEIFWSGLHGLVTLSNQGRLQPNEHARRLAMLIEHSAR